MEVEVEGVTFKEKEHGDPYKEKLLLIVGMGEEGQ